MRQPQRNCCSCHTNSQCMACRTYCCGHRIAGCLTTKFYYEASPRRLTTKSHHKVSPQSFTHEALPQSPLGGPAGKSNTGTQLKRFFSRGSSQEVPARRSQPGSSNQEVPAKKFPSRRIQPSQENPSQEAPSHKDPRQENPNQEAPNQEAPSQGVPAKEFQPRSSSQEVPSQGFPIKEFQLESHSQKGLIGRPRTKLQ